MVTLQVHIDPLDPLLFGDNRSARAGEDHALGDQDPSPATFYGAVCARIATRLGALGRGGSWDRAEGVLGPWHAGLEGGDPDRSQLLAVIPTDPHGAPWFPRPLHLRLQSLPGSGRLYRGDLLRPIPSEQAPLSSLPAGLRPLVPGAELAPVPDLEEEESPLLLDRRLLESALTAPEGLALTVDDLAGSTATPEDFHLPDFRLGLAMDNRTNTAQEGRLFSRPYRRFKGGFGSGGYGTAGFTAWLRLPGLDGHAPEEWDGVGFLGGDRRRVRLGYEVCAHGEPLEPLLDAVVRAAEGSRGFVAYLLTPAVAREPESVELAGRAPVAAAIGHPRHVSGWQAAGGSQGPRPIRTLVPSGSAYFFEWTKEEGADARREILRSLWLAPLDPDFRNPGFGRLLPGVWR